MKKTMIVAICLLVPAVTSALTLEQGEFKAKLNGLELWYKSSGLNSRTPSFLGFANSCRN